ncbi:UDP-glucose 4-epimerase [Candidatus Planktophila vernalis]|uniref:UDP-glucuronate decarboxylase n=1 Tax=Candidatus Planktophila vernalis TaxID=1884907 RepID=A0A249KUM2_9ACTN|nr:GDP-mannose 4,6-dehydratase [Candidatus Planktophila vernalis]ASY20498.1 UDP-glucose 4-epimerase [Candidatus Planktophila vernalis]
MKILVTGGAGFIGSHLVERLLNLGHEVSVLDDLSTGSMENLESTSDKKNLEVIEGSVLDSELVSKQVANSDYVFHLAAAVGVFNIVQKPLQSLSINLTGTENVLSAADKFSVPVLIASSSEIYGKNTSDSLSENSDRILGNPLTLRWSYSEAKAIDESFAYAYFVEKSLEIRIARFFNTVGPRQLGAYGMVVPRFVSSALENSPITIYGSGDQSRCFIHVQDAVDALVGIAFSKNTIGRAINIGNSTEISILKLAEFIKQRLKSKSEIVFLDYEEAYGNGFEDMQRRVPDITLIKQLIEWEPQLSLENIVDDIAKAMKR